MYYTFTINRTLESLNEPCQVIVKISGTANHEGFNDDCSIQFLDGVYSSFHNEITVNIPGGISTADIKVFPNTDNPPAEDKNIIFTIDPNPGVYQLGTSISAEAIIPGVVYNQSA
jgi:hypothetical protein